MNVENDAWSFWPRLDVSRFCFDHSSQQVLQKRGLLENHSTIHAVICVKRSICIGFSSDQHKAHQLLSLLHKVKVMCDAGRDAMGPQPQLPVSNTCPVQTHLLHVEYLLSDVSMYSFAFCLPGNLLQNLQRHQFQHPHIPKFLAIVKSQSLLAGLWPCTGIFVCQCNKCESQFWTQPHTFFSNHEWWMWQRSSGDAAKPSSDIGACTSALWLLGTSRAVWILQVPCSTICNRAVFVGPA